ncbi:MAG: ATP-binding cassette domain-containing protein [Fimbriimonadaceae bacterium]
MVHLSRLTKRYGEKVLFQNASFQLNPGDKVGLVGPNGAGKTTIFRLITGEQLSDEGQISKPEKTVIGYFSQNIEAMSGQTVLDEVKSAAGRLAVLQKQISIYEAKLSEEMPEDEMMKVLEHYGEMQAEFERLGGYDLDTRAAEIITGLGIMPEDHQRDTGTFSGGWKMRIALAKILVLNPDVLLMDEPTNHLDLESIVWLEDWLRNYKGALLMTSHDRDFMNRLVDRIIEVAHQTITVYTGMALFMCKCVYLL